MVYQFYCMALFHSQTRRHMIKLINKNVIHYRSEVRCIGPSVWPTQVSNLGPLTVPIWNMFKKTFALTSFVDCMTYNVHIFTKSAEVSMDHFLLQRKNPNVHVWIINIFFILVVTHQVTEWHKVLISFKSSDHHAGPHTICINYSRSETSRVYRDHTACYKNSPGDLNKYNCTFL